MTMYTGETGDHCALPRTAAQARSYVRGLVESGPVLGSAEREAFLADVLLVVSELVTNALRHGGGITEFEAEVGAEGLRLTIGDARSEFPTVRPREAGAGVVGGYGWPLVARLSQHVTVTPVPAGGKRIEVLVPLGLAAGEPLPG
ncbi:ATP-binding protein [Streptomyces sp. NPDC058655]|uniref:ATP-binding protein n=1 Tax=Streptomyces sp. NPDC058655 TaxID=3346577 RepID=UPI0036531B2F